MAQTATRSTVKSRKKAADKKAKSTALKRQPSKSAAQIRAAQQAADRGAGSADIDSVMRAAASRRHNVDRVVFDTEHELEATSLQIGQDRPRDMPTSGPAMLEPREIEMVDGPNWKDKAAALAFMEEKVRVMVHDTTDKNESKIVEVWVGGVAQRFMRNVPQVCRRKFVAALATAKNTAYSQEHYKDTGGYDALRNNPHTALRYPFSMIQDPNPMGGAWLAKALAEG